MESHRNAIILRSIASVGEKSRFHSSHVETRHFECNRLFTEVIFVSPVGMPDNLKDLTRFMRTAKSSLFSVAFLALLSGPTARAQVQPCTITKAQRALDRADTLRSWDALHSSYKEFRNCDDGAIAEGYSESVARILADHWSTLSRFVQLAGNDRSFREFVIRHIDATLNMDDVEKIKKAALTQCPTGLRTTCSDIAKQTDFALKDAAAR